MSDLDLIHGFSKEARYVAESKASATRRLQESAMGTKAVLLEELSSVWEECRQPNWDGHNALAVEQETFRNAYLFLESFPLGFPQPTIGAEPDGHITLEWYHSPRRVLSVSVSPEADLHFAAILGPSRRSGTEPFFDETPGVILDLIRQTCVC
jgi:hypothetical protein